MLRCESLSRTYVSGGRELTVLKDISFAVESGGFVAIVGPSGSGKTTLLGLLAGLDRPSSGRVWLDGQPLDTLDEDDRARLRREKVGFVFQSFHLIPTLTARENVQVPLELRGERRRRRSRRELLERVGPRRTAATTTRPSSPAASSSASRSPARSATGRGSCSPTSRPATSTPATGAVIIELMGELNRELGHHAGAGHPRSRPGRRAQPHRSGSRMARMRLRHAARVSAAGVRAADGVAARAARRGDGGSLCSWRRSRSASPRSSLSTRSPQNLQRLGARSRRVRCSAPTSRCRAAARSRRGPRHVLDAELRASGRHGVVRRRGVVTELRGDGVRAPDARARAWCRSARSSPAIPSTARCRRDPAAAWPGFNADAGHRRPGAADRARRAGRGHAGAGRGAVRHRRHGGEPARRRRACARRSGRGCSSRRGTSTRPSSSASAARAELQAFIKLPAVAPPSADGIARRYRPRSGRERVRIRTVADDQADLNDVLARLARYLGPGRADRAAARRHRRRERRARVHPPASSTRSRCSAVSAPPAARCLAIYLLQAARLGARGQRCSARALGVALQQAAAARCSATSCRSTSQCGVAPRRARHGRRHRGLDRGASSRCCRCSRCGR